MGFLAARPWLEEREAPRGEGRPGQWAFAVLAALALTVPAGAAPRPPGPRLDPDPGTTQEAPTAVGRISPAVVGIRARIAPDRPSAAALGTERRGSGVIVDPDGTILTTGYLVLEAGPIEVTLPDGRVRAARVLGHDFESGLGVIRLADGGVYPAATLGRSAPVAPGQPVAVVGMTPQGRLLGAPGTVTAVGEFVAYWEYMLARAIWVAPIHPAFGGAALVDVDGALVGIVSLRLEGAVLAIPIDLVRPVWQALVADGRPARPPRPWLGVRLLTMDGGVLVAGVSPVGPAHAAGLRPGDVIVRLNGDRVADLADFYRRLWRLGAGPEIELTVHRDGQLDAVRVRPRDRHTIFQFRTP